MSDFFQSGLHPDADMLNAFAERVLPPHEHQQMLGHLAVCSECRAVVSAASPPLDEVIPPHTNPVRKPWFSGWNLAWPVAVALAALLLIVLHVRQNPYTRSAGGKQKELAESRPPAPPVSPGPQTTVTEKPLATSQELQQRLRRPLDTDKLADSGMRAAAKPAAAPGKERDEGVNATNRLIGQSQSLSGNVGAVEGGRGIATAAAPLAGGIDGAIGGSTLASSPPATRSPQAAVDSAAARSAAQTAVVNNANLIALAPISGAAALKSPSASAPTPLPSGLPVMSTSSIGQIVLALDTANTLFYSSNNGRQWKPIASQWKGRALRVDRAEHTGTSALYAAERDTIRSSTASNSIELKAKSAVDSKGSSLTGTVTDATGASIPDASVAVSDATKQTVQAVKSDAAGRYQVDGLASGSYKIEATAPGFQKLEQPVTLASAQQDVANLKLQVGSASETVSVTAESQPVVTSRSLAKKAAAAPAPAKPAPLFEITTDTGDHWISIDGLNWMRR